MWKACNLIHLAGRSRRGGAQHACRLNHVSDSFPGFASYSLGTVLTTGKRLDWVNNRDVGWIEAVPMAGPFGP